MDSESQSAPDTGAPETSVPEMGASDAGAPDTRPSDTKTPDIKTQEVERVPARPVAAPRNRLLPVMLIVAPLLLLAIYSKFVYAGLINAEALDFAQIGRNLSAGHGMVTYVLRPLALTHGANLVRQPDVMHGPLYPFLLAIAFGAMGARDTAASCVSGLFYVLTIPLVYALGLRVFNRTVGLVAAAAFGCSGVTLQYAVSGLHITLYTFLITALFLALYNLGAGKRGQKEAADAPLSTGLLALIGVLTGLLYLADPIFIWISPVILGSVLWICGPQRRVSVLKFLAPCVLVMAPWMVRNLLITGNPVFALRGAELWMNTPHHYPGHIGYGLYSEEFARGPYLLPAVFRKVLLGLNSVFRALPQIPDAWLIIFLMPCLFFVYSSRTATILRMTMVFSGVALLLGMLLFQLDLPLLSCLVPTLLIFAIAYLTHLIRQAKLSSASTWGLAVLLGSTILYPLMAQMFLEEKVHPLEETAAAQGMGKIVPVQGAVLTDHPEAVAWYANRPAIQLPAVDTRVADIRSQFPDTRWLFLTPQVRMQSLQWQELYDQCAHWNAVYVQRQMRNAELPPLIRISSTSQPLFRALTGFTSVAPMQNASPSTVIAALPEAKLSMGSEPNPRSAP